MKAITIVVYGQLFMAIVALGLMVLGLINFINL